MKKQKKIKQKTTKTKTKVVSKGSKNKQYIQKEEEEAMKQLPQPYKFENNGESVQILLHNPYTIKEDHKIFQNLLNFYKLYTEKQKRRNRKHYTLSQYSYFPTFEFLLANEKPEENKCSICQFQFQDKDVQAMEKQLIDETDQDIIMLKCTHLIHYSCFQMLIGQKQWFKCPVCATIYGKMIGDQPPGNMTVFYNDHMHCDGFPQCGTIVIQMSMHAGKRGVISFPSTHRTAYLPNNPQGKQILDLYQQAFDRKLIFTVGRSVTTGRDNQIVWNGIHFKTNTTGGSSHFGYPDPTYFDRVKLELAAKGIY